MLIDEDKDSNFEYKLNKVLNEIKELLLKKNESYGNSALEPIHCFYKGTAKEAIKVRIDDKLSRLMKGKEYGQDDTILDLLGYLIIYKIAEMQ
ncbi:MAG: hypothetical protein NC222_06805 [Staphylococcus sp.]|nr:hypothetical protein [Staphylococcus sp.]